ncbi:hypothetical protein CON15_19665 [Bacillus cereus]|uniref:Uncharacterized protein n=1 Tax=Bacillus thuringiensis TaxID=1428 RepID=A0AB36VEY7_BACTU|nr:MULTISPECIES: hypothetical protein [Bacillus cereus group]MRA82457.1 hypothetical protein [Bacillus thuringiensis]PDZ55760.1 hypothetical protein CON15_19665 [Bacillus cereus]PFC28533.1 hypothetical protein CN299_19885 [Bacillus thuringiensis]PFO26164.1 hypothetical protein COJ78_29110 [Bacillus thuringiensis]PFS40380.1 hypothetical protein COK48_00620 [Bacillus thuringiensis]
MGVDFYPCENCGETFPDCGYYVSCECGMHWCSDGCAEEHGHESREDEETGYEESSCMYCREEDFDDNSLLYHALDLLNMDRQQIIGSYKTTKQSEGE